MTRPLDGITVVTLEHAIAAPFCTRQLADLGGEASTTMVGEALAAMVAAG